MSIIISVVCPTLNEARHIEELLRFFVSSKPVEKELFIIDGGSVDETQSIVQRWVSQYKHIHLLDNPNKYVAYALNQAIPQCVGKYIVRLDAHSDYAEDYFEQILQTFENTGADIVGGAYRTKSLGSTQTAIAYAISTKLGIGNSLVHQPEYKGYSDSVAFGAWRREIFAKTGFFDQRLVRNQDDEFHYRAKYLGLTIYQSPEIKLYYYPRTTIKGLFLQYYQYGVYKPLVLWKIPKEAKIRHLIPAGFVLYLVLLYPLFIISPFFGLPLVFYLFFIVYVSLLNHLSWISKAMALIVYPVIHLAYGLGFWRGLFLLNK